MTSVQSVTSCLRCPCSGRFWDFQTIQTTKLSLAGDIMAIIRGSTCVLATRCEGIPDSSAIQSSLTLNTTVGREGQARRRALPRLCLRASRPIIQSSSYTYRPRRRVPSPTYTRCRLWYGHMGYGRGRVSVLHATVTAC